MQEIQLIFNPGKGASVSLGRITAVVGDRVGAMPKPTRRGYIFAGWYIAPGGDTTAASAMRVSPETVLDMAILGGKPEDIVLYAKWEKNKAEQKKNSLRTQKRAIVVVAILTGVFILTLIGASILSNIYSFTDVNGDKYTIRKHNGEFALFDGGELCDSDEDGSFFYYITKHGTQVEIDPDTGEYTIFAVVDTSDTEEVSVIGTNQRVLMFKKLTYDESSTSDITRIIKSIEIHNQHGTYTVVRGDSNRFDVKDHPTAILDDTLFAQLSNGCGYTISMQRLENPVRLPDGSIDYSEYGLAPETRVELDDEGNEVPDEDGNPVTYEYTPTWYTITTMSGDAYTVTLGDPTISSAGYYARYGDRDTIYILSSTNIDATVLQPVEALITPLMVYPMTMSTYFNVKDFIYRSGFDHIEILREEILYLIGEDIRDLDTEDEEAVDALSARYIAALEALYDPDRLEENKDAIAKYEDVCLQAWSNNSDLVTQFSYIDLTERENTLYSSLPYLMSSSYMDGYLPNSDNIGTMLQKLQAMTFVGVTVLGPDEDDLYDYGLDEYAHDFSFTYTDADGQEFTNHFVVSQKTEDGLYYAYSENFDMIVCFDESQAEYLDWEEIDWYEREYFQCNIAHVQTIKLEGTGLTAPILFTLDNSASDQSEGISSSELKVYANGILMDYKLEVTKPSGSRAEEDADYNFRRFFQALLSASMEGNADLTDEEMTDLREGEEFLKITVLADDAQGSTMYNVYRFYRYTERKAYMTIETLTSPDDPGNAAEGQGTFYVKYSFCEKLIADAYRFMEGTEIVVDSKS